MSLGDLKRSPNFPEMWQKNLELSNVYKCVKFVSVGQMEHRTPRAEYTAKGAGVLVKLGGNQCFFWKLLIFTTCIYVSITCQHKKKILYYVKFKNI